MSKPLTTILPCWGWGFQSGTFSPILKVRGGACLSHVAEWI